MLSPSVVKAARAREANAPFRVASVEALRDALWIGEDAPLLVFVGGDRGGWFELDEADTTTPDNNGTVFLTTFQLRYKRQYDGAPRAIWFDVRGEGDERAKLQALVNLGVRVRLEPKTYSYSGGLDHVTGAGFICDVGYATFRAITGPTGFNNKSDALPRTGLDRNMFRCKGTDDLTLRNIHFTTDGVTPVVLNALRIDGGMAGEGYDCKGLSFSDFFIGRCLALNSLGGGKKRIIEIDAARNCGTSLGNAYFTSAMQMTVGEIDNDLVGGVASVGGRIHCSVLEGILHSGAQLSDNGQQTDGFNIIGQTSGWKITVDRAVGVGELFDIFGSRNYAFCAYAKNIWNDAIKMIHGPNGNYAEIAVLENSGRSGIAFFGSTVSGIGDTTANTAMIRTLINPGTFGLGLSGTTYGILFGNTTTTWKPKGAVATIENLHGDGVNLDYGICDGGTDQGLGNIATIGRGGGWAIAACTAPASNVQFRTYARCYTEMALAANQTPIAPNTPTKVAFAEIIRDLEGIANATTNKIRPGMPGLYRVEVQVCCGAWDIGVGVDLVLRKGSAEVARDQRVLGSGVKCETPKVDTIIYIDETESSADFWAEITHDASGDRLLSDINARTFFKVTRVG